MQFIDLKRQHQRIEASIKKRINTVLGHGNFILGPEIKELEQKLAEYAGTRYCLSCASGTDALLLSLMTYNVGPGDAVFTSPFTFVATAEVIALLGATPVFVDIDPVTYNIDPKKLAESIDDAKKGKGRGGAKGPQGLKLRGIIPVDIFGLPADYDAINRIAKENGLFVIEDAAQSFGGTYKGRKTCSLAPVAATSFFPAKPLGCYGDGGAIFTDDNAFFEILGSLRVHGQGPNKYENVRIGINGRMDTIQAAVLLAKMELFGEEVELRQKVAARYSSLLKDHDIIVPTVPEGYSSAWAQYSIQSEDRHEIMGRLKNTGIPTAIYYPKPLHLQTAFSYLEYEKGSMPVSERVADRIFSLPMHPYLTEEEQVGIADYFKE
jgi:Predicted pyridoxal phosphate-dependent enzyme apparently involved in regulation of cell wall biogenesis